MSENSTHDDFEILWVVVNDDLGHKVLKTAYKHGILGGTIMLAMGYLKGKLLRLLELDEVRREVVMMVTNKTIAATLLPVLEKEFHLNKLYHGLAFSVSVDSFLGKCTKQPNIIVNRRKDSDRMYNVIFTIVERGRGEEVVEAALKAGSKGATIINARGSGVNDTCRLFAMEIETEKEVIMVIANKEETQKVVLGIRKLIDIDNPCSGVVFVQEIDQIYGLF